MKRKWIPVLGLAVLGVILINAGIYLTADADSQRDYLGRMLFIDGLLLLLPLFVVAVKWVDEQM